MLETSNRVVKDLLRISRSLAEEHYAEHRGKPFYEGLVRYIMSGPVIAMVLSGEEAVAVTRAVVGKTDPRQSPPGTIRGDFGMSIRKNIIHASDSGESARREISLFFGETDIQTYTRIDEMWLYSNEG